MASLARLLVRIFFRSVELEGGDNLPGHGPVVVVANHTNGLVDGLLLMAALGRYPRFLGKSTLFRIPPLWPFLKFAGVIPVVRASDGDAGARNASAFGTCREILARGDVVALFPEGISHDELSLQPLRTGAARIALDAAFEGGLEDVQTLPVGLTYDAKARFRSRALVHVGKPAPVAAWRRDYQSNSHEAVRRLTEDLAERLSAVSPAYASWQQAEQVARVAEVVARQVHARPRETTLADQVEVAGRLARVEQDDPGATRMRGVLAAYAVYERDLTVLGLRDAQVSARYSRAGLRASLAWSVVKILAALPFAAIGAVVHVIPFQIIKQLAKKPRNEGIKATVKLLGCFASFTLVYAALGFLVGRAYGALPGLGASIAAPLCGYVAVRLAERVKRIGGVLAGYRIVRERPGDLDAVLAHRAAVVDCARAALGTP
jgi:1-acyl-sn-glycerol-3-phosphate acyltransferase